MYTYMKIIENSFNAIKKLLFIKLYFLHVFFILTNILHLTSSYMIANDIIYIYVGTHFTYPILSKVFISFLPSICDIIRS